MFCLLLFHQICLGGGNLRDIKKDFRRFFNDYEIEYFYAKLFAIDKVQFDKTHTKSNICFHTFDCASATSFAKHLNIRPKICLQMYIA